jgi:3D (Asp-Asp-Asp) domain-containing protein
VAVLLGAETLDEAIGGLDGLRSIASGDRDLLQKVREAHVDLAQAKRSVVARVAALRKAEAEAAATTASLTAARAERAQYLAQLARQRGFNARRLERVRTTARAAGERTVKVEVTQAEAAATAATPEPVPVPAYSGGEQTLTVTSTGYAIRGRTASGLPTGWGIVAVDPSVIPLGTRMTIPGYGEGVAADTGGAVRGATIDLWFPTLSQALAWGRRTVTITLHG